MATVDQILDTARTYMDEPDQTFLSHDVLDGLMNIAYQSFRQKVMEADPNILARTTDVTMTANSVDLSTIPIPILGAGAFVVTAGNRLVKLLSVYTLDSATGLPNTMFSGVGAFQGLTSGGSVYYLQGDTLWLSSQVNATVRLLYVADGTDVIWNPTSTGPPPGPVYDGNARPDNLSPVHDLIALYAYRQYQMMDSAVSEPLMLQIRSREKALEEYLLARSVGGPNYVQDVTSRDFFI